MTTLFGHGVRSDLVVSYVIEALSVVAAVYLLSAWSFGGEDAFAFGHNAAVSALLALSAGAVSGAIGFYQPSSWPHAIRVWANALVGGLLLLWLAKHIIVTFPPIMPTRSDGQGLVALALAFAAAIAVPRLGFAAATRHGLLRPRVAMVLGPRGIGGAKQGAERGEAFTVALTVPDGAPLDDALALRHLRRQRVWAVVVAEDATMPADLRRRCEAAGVHVFGQAQFQEWCLGRVDLDRLPQGWLATARGADDRGLERALRRGMDVAASLALVVFTLPLLLLTALAIKLDSPGPVFYRQERVGQGGRVFMLVKFRSMVVDAEEVGKPQWASRRDSRVTRVGRFIRLTRIDEVPQVLNVLRGDMAMVGPRPERPGFVEQLGQAIPRYHDRACVKPGITGWAQVKYPYGASVEDARMKLAYDLYYVRRRSILLDLLVLMATVRVVLLQEGAR